MRRCLPGLSTGLAAMFAVIANRLERGLSVLIRIADDVNFTEMLPLTRIL